MLSILSIHYIGNKTQEELLFLSKQSLDLADDLKLLLSDFFLTAFKTEEHFSFYHESDLALNEAYTYAARVFENPDTLHEQSVYWAQHLYRKSDHPQIKPGELYVAYFPSCTVAGETVDAIGLFKTENRDTFLKVHPQGEVLSVVADQGVHTRKLDKGCMIYNLERENGYVVGIVDNTNKGVEARYWTDGFLQVQQKQNAYANTENTMSLYKNFVAKELPDAFEVSKVDQAALLNRSVQYFKEKEQFDINEFETEVLGQPDVIDSFHTYKEQYQRDRALEIADQFDISASAFKKQSRNFKSVIKLDKNFHIYVHGNRKLIEQGMDENGRKYYKIYYEQEQ